MKVTIAMLVVYVLTLVVEVQIGLSMLIEPSGTASAIGPASRQLPGSLGGAIEAIFVALIIVFIFYGWRGMRLELCRSHGCWHSACHSLGVDRADRAVGRTAQ
jgi:hypothetical protein